MSTDQASTDDELMLAYAAGDQAAFARLYERYRGPLYRYLRRHLPAAECDDCFQTLWLRVIDHAPGYRPRGSFNGYVFTLAHNLVVDRHRSRSGRSQVPAEQEEVEAALADGAANPPEAALVGDRLRRRLLTVLERLPFHQREAWVLKQEAAMTVAEIAAVTGTSIEGVRSRLRYATRQLKAGLARHV